MNKLKIVYIEDDEGQRASFTQTLQSRGFEVTAVPSGKEGIQVVQKSRADVILCDLNMPEMNGLAVLKQVRIIDKKVPVIMLTAHGKLDQAVKALQQGAYDFVLKPLEINKIETTIYKAIEKTNLQKELQQSEASLHMLMDNVPDIIYSLNSKGEFLNVNPAVKSLLGYKPQEMLGTLVFDYIYSEDWERVKSSFEQAMSCCDISVKTLEFRMVTKTGEIKDFEVNRRLIFENGKVVRQDGIARDVTRRKQFKDELQRYSEELEKLVNDRTEKLAFTTRQLAALNAVSNRFTLIYNEEELFDEAPELLTHSLDFDRALMFIAKNGELKLQSFCLEKDTPELVENFLKMVRTKKNVMPPHLLESFNQNKTIFIPDLNADSKWPRTRGQIIRTKAVVISPIKVNKIPIGVIVGNMQHHEREMDAQDVVRFEMFTNMVGLALDNIRAYQSLEKKVVERTKSLKNANRELLDKAKELEESTYSLAYANIELLAVQEQLEKKNSEMENLLKAHSESNTRLLAILDSSLSAIIMVDNENRVISGNKRIQEFFGLEFNKILNKPIQLFYEKIKNCFEDYNKLNELVKKLQISPDAIFDEGIEIEKIYERSFKVIKPAERFISIFSVPVVDKDNNELGKVWTYSDITKMRLADEQLRAIVEASPIPFIVSRQSDGKIFYANNPIAELLGLNKNALIGRHTPDYYYNRADREIIQKLVKRDGFLRNHEVRIRNSKGDGLWIILSIEMAEVGGEPVYIGALYDINKRRQAEEALQESEERFRNLVENANDIIYSMTPEGKFTYVSPNWTDILGHSVAEVLGKSFETFVHPDDLAACREYLRTVIETGEKQSSFEYRVKHKDGSWRWHTSSASPLKDEKDNVVIYIGIAHDITERKKFIDELAQANRHLQETQGKLVQSEKMASLGMLVAGIAHEINTPIGAVHSMHDTLQRAVEKLKQTLETQFPKEYYENRGLSIPLKIIDEANKVIENGSERVTNIVRRLRSFARLDEAELKTADIHEGLEDTLTLVHHEIKHNITVIKNFGDIPAVACFPGRLNQVYLNLLINAKQAIKDKGEITITTSLMDHNVRIEIQDNGVGIPKEKLKKVFDPGFTTKGVGVGTGLGLSICYQILQDHHGEIQVESEVGKGTKFTIVFPMNLDEILERT